MAKQQRKTFYGDNDFRHWYGCLGERGREEFQKWLSSISVARPDNDSNINYDYCECYCDDIVQAGDKMVYVYTSELGIPFYVGYGSWSRPLDITTREQEFKEMIDGKVCRIFGIVSNMRDDAALDVETLCIWELLRRGWKLCNKSKISIDEDKYKELREEYPIVLDNLNKMTSSAMTLLLEDIDEFGNRGKVVKHGKTRMGEVS